METASSDVKTLDATDLSLKVVRTVAELDALEQTWNGLLERSHATLFQTYEWQRTWWRFFGEGHAQTQLYVLIVYDRERVRAIAPLFIERLSVMGMLGIRRLSFIGREISDYLDMIAEYGYEDVAVRMFIAHLVTNAADFDAILLEDIPDRSILHQRLHEGLTYQGFAGDRFEGAQCPRTSLKGTWDETLASFSKKHRKDVAYELRNITRHFSVEFELTSRREDVERNVSDFVAMHQQRWTLAGHPGALRDTLHANFHKAFGTKCFDRGWLFLAFLRLNNRRVAVNYGFHFRNTLSTYLNGMIDLGEISKYSPGKVLHEYSMEEATKRGCSTYDFLRGRERYKYTLEAVDVPNWTIVLSKKSSGSTIKKLKFYLLMSSLRRRLREEWAMLGRIAGEHGWASKNTLNHLKARIRQNSRDSLKKVKSPEKALRE